MSRQDRFFSRQDRETLAILAGGVCPGCGSPLTEENTQADHVLPYSRGGATTLENGQALCASCNARKGARMPETMTLIRPAAVEIQSGALGAAVPGAPRFIPTAGFNDRHSQTGFMDAFQQICIDLGKPYFLAEMGPGAGKTACGVSAAHHLFEQYRAEIRAGVPRDRRRGARIVVIMTPTRGIKSEWANEFEKFEKTSGVSIPVRAPMGAGKWAGTAGVTGFPPDGTVILVSPQAVSTQGVRDALKMMIYKLDGEVAVIVDEVHHCAETNTWGACVAAASEQARLTIGLSGTPYRHDDGMILGARKNAEGAVVPDYRYSRSQALADGVVARLFFKGVEGEIEEKDGRTGKVLRSGKLSECRDKLADDFLRVALKPGAETLDACIEEGIRILEWVREHSKMPLEAAGAVQCANTRQLRYVKAFLEARGYKVMTTYSGDGQKPQDVIEAFRNGEGDFILGIRRLTEGVNIARLRVGVNVNHGCMTQQAFDQFSGRLERLIHGFAADLQHGYIVIPRHHRLLKYAEEHEKATREAEVLRKVQVCDCPGCGAQIPVSASLCPYCETENPRNEDRTPWENTDPVPDPTEVEQWAYVANCIHGAMSLSIEEVAELAAAYDTRCARAGLWGADVLSSEAKAFRELRLRSDETSRQEERAE